MVDFQAFMDSRKNLNFHFKTRNILSFILFAFLSYSIFTTIKPNIEAPELVMGLFMSCVSLTLILSIFTFKMRAVVESRKNNESLHGYMQEAISLARQKGDYSVVNSLLDSKYSVHMILVMSKFPITSLDFTQLTKWEKLPQALSYFQKHNFVTEDLTDHSRMSEYLKAVYPEFLTALAQSQGRL